MFVKIRYDTVVTDISLNHAESLTVKITLPNTELLLIAIYRPPNNSVTRFLRELEEILEGHKAADQICLAGDLNINILNISSTTVSDYLSILSTYGLQVTINQPTREELLQNRLVSSCLDHIAIRAPNYSLEACIIRQKIADHYFVACRLKALLPLPEKDKSEEKHDSNQLKVQILNKRTFDHLIAQFDWAEMIKDCNYAKVYEKFCEQLKNLSFLVCTQ